MLEVVKNCEALPFGDMAREKEILGSAFLGVENRAFVCSGKETKDRQTSNCCA